MSEKTLVEESFKTKKVREKLIKHFQKLDAQVTEYELNKRISDIHRWISRHAPERISFKEKSFSLFDENQNAALVSDKVATLIVHLRKKIEEEQNILI
jgi:lysyl-tRNA synthetase class I